MLYEEISYANKKIQDAFKKIKDYTIKDQADKVIDITDLKTAIGALNQFFIKDSEPNAAPIAKAEEDREKWRSASSNQVSFINNLLILIGCGFLGFVLKDLVDVTLNFTLVWRKIDFTLTKKVVSVTTMAFSVFSGLLCGYNRMLVFAYQLRISKQKLKLLSLGGTPPPETTHNSKWIQRYFIRLGRWFCKPNSFSYKNDDTADILAKNIDWLLFYADRFGIATRNLLYSQIWFFSISIMFYILFHIK